MIRFAPALSLVCLALAGPVLANDATASLDTGELRLVPNPHIRMAEEDLYIGPSAIRVRYLFENTGPEAITTLVAFPLPPVDYEYDTSYPLYPADPVDIVGFQLWIDGQPAPFQIEAKALTQDGRDITALLDKWDIPLTTLTPDNETFDALRDRLDRLPPDAMAELRAMGAIHSWDAGFAEAWEAYVTYYWPMTFPAGAQVTVEHAYTPAGTYTFFGPYDLEARSMHDEVCIDQGFEAAVRKRLQQGPGMMQATILSYILTTANNWRGPIGRFHLTVDKESTDTLVSLCRDGIRKTGPTTFEWEATDYTPTRDLKMLFVKPFPQEP